VNSLEFLKLILPAEGTHYLVAVRNGGMTHMPYSSLEKMAEGIEHANRNNLTVYHACAAYTEHSIVEDDKKKYRVPKNWKAAKALWVDIDCGEEKALQGKGYQDKQAGAGAVLRFCKTLGLSDAYLVSSGYGVHAYWPLSEEIPPEDWCRIAAKLKATLAHAGVAADPTSTADFSRILRPIGSYNRKNPDTPKLVKAITNGPPEITNAEFFEQQLDAYVSEFEVKSVQVPRQYEQQTSDPDDINNDLTGHIEYPNIPTSAALAAEKCKQLALMRDTQGDVGYEHWRGVIGIISHCEEGLPLAQSWSERRADTGHSQTDVEQKFMTWNSGPTTCEFFKACNPEGCAGCAFADKVKTPLVLGRKEIEPEATVAEAVIEGKPVEVDVPKLPNSYNYDAGVSQMVHMVRDKDGLLDPFPFAHSLFYLTTRICQQDGTFLVRCRMHLPDKRVREFDIETGTIIGGGQKLIERLGSYELSTTNHKDAAMHMTAYLKDSLRQLMHTSQEMNTMKSFGWKDNMQSFLLGDRLYSRDGTVRRVILGGNAATKAKMLHAPIGGAQGWTDGVNYIYNRDGMEPMQYAICSAFGSLLGPFGEDQYRGIPVALTGSGSGKGKTTACRAALYAFGDADELTVNGSDGATVNARYAMMGTLHNIPLLIDEITNIKPLDLSALMYAASNGKEKIRLMAGKNVGVTFAEESTWNMSLYLTANKHLALALASEKGNTEAESVRFIEIQTDTYQTPVLDTVRVGAAVTKIARNAGCAGEVFVKHIVGHTDEISDMFIDMSEKLALSASVVQNPQYRFYRQHAVCTLVAAKLLKDLKVIDFDLDKLMAWTVKHIEKMCADVVEFNTITGEDALNQMINDMSPRVLVTAAYKDSRNGGVVEPTKSMSKSPVGRFVMGTSDGREPLAGRLYLVKKDVRQWCLDNRVDIELVVGYALEKDILIKEKDDRFAITRGTEHSGGSLRCWCFDMNKMQDVIAGVPQLKLVAQDKKGAAK
jgi:hypothetical protein